MFKENKKLHRTSNERMPNPEYEVKEERAFITEMTITTSIQLK